MKTLIILMLLLSLGACKKSKDSGSSKNPTPPPTPSTPPTINEITSGPKTHKNEDQVEFVVTFSHAVKVSEGQSPFLALTVGDQTRQAHFDRGSEENQKGVQLFFIYEVQPNDNDSDGVSLAKLSIDLNGGSIKDDAGQDVTNTIPEKYQNFPNVKVDALHPTISEVQALNIDPGVDTIVSKNETVDLEATFSEPVKITGSPSLALSVGGSSARAIYQPGGGQSVRATHTFRYTVQEGEGGSIQVTGMVGENSNFISDEAGNKTEENILSPLSVSGITVYTPLCSRSVQSTGFNGGDGSESSPYIICTYTQLDKMRDDLTAHYELAQDIDARESWSVGDDGCTAYDGSTVPTTTPCTGWVSVGTVETGKCDGDTDDACFQGHFDGGGYVISNLYLNISSSSNIYGGLFGAIGGQAYIFHIGFIDVSLTMTTSSGDLYAGSLVGYSSNGGTIINSYITGASLTTNNTSSDTSDRLSTGGLVGYSLGTIINSYATAVSSTTNATTHSSCGGLVGGGNSVAIYNSYAVGTVSGSSTKSINVGGLVGDNTGGWIYNSYATATVSGTNSGYDTSYVDIGGLVGFQLYSNFVSNNYATGTATASCDHNACTAYSGGFIGRVSSSVINGTNYFVHSSGGDNGIGSGSCSEDSTCARKTLVELQGLTSTDVTDWSTDNWDFGTTTQLPRLKYTEIAAYCRDSTYTTKETCEAASSRWLAEGDECNGDTGVVCGDIIPGQ